MIEIEKPKIETVEINEDNSTVSFVVEPLERGYGRHWEILCAVSCCLLCPVQPLIPSRSTGCCTNFPRFPAL